MGNAFKGPSKEDVRKYMQRRLSENTPPPSMKQIRRELGWDLAVASGHADGLRAYASGGRG